MTSRERVVTALSHREPDRVPIDQGAMRSSGLMAIAYNRLKRHLGLAEETTFVYDLVQQLALPEPWFLERFHVDAIDLGRAFAHPDGWKPWNLPDGSPAQTPAWFRPERENGGLIIRDDEGDVIGRMPEGFTCIDQVCWPLSAPDGLDNFKPLQPRMKKVTWAAIPSAPFDEALTDERLDKIGYVARQLYETSDRAIVLSVGCNLFEWTQFLFGPENQYAYLAGEKEKMCAVLDELTDIHIEFLGRILPKIRGSVQVLVMGDDLGMQRGPQISRQMYREMFFPRHRRIYEFAKRESGAHIMLHSCGGIYPLIPDLIEAGVDILNPVQTSARNMEPEKLKREFGKDVSFWGGGCDTQHTLIHGTPEEVRDDVRRRLDIFMPGGGFVWNQVHNVLADVPPQNIVAMLEAAYEFGVYSGAAVEST
jgi:uroporphyrinogen decarboxylase